MFTNPVPLKPEEHKNIRIRQTPTIEHLKNTHMAAVSVHEFVAAATHYPIMFVKEPVTGKCRPIILWGLEAEENLFIKDDKWDGAFIPAGVRCFPFMSTVQEREGEKRVFLGLYQDSELVNEEEGERIFDENGEQTEWFKKLTEFINTSTQRDQMTMAFAEELVRLELISPLNLSYKTPDGDERKITDLMGVEPEKLSKLSDEDYLKLRKAGFLDPIYAHLVSLENINRLLQRRYGNRS